MFALTFFLLNFQDDYLFISLFYFLRLFIYIYIYLESSTNKQKWSSTRFYIYLILKIIILFNLVKVCIYALDFFSSKT